MQDTTTYILAIDQDTASTGAMLFDHDRRICALARKETAVLCPQPGWVQQNAETLWLDTAAVMARVLNQAGIAPDQVAAIGISSQRETTILWDRHTGLPVYEAIGWQSRQSAGICRRWKEQGYGTIVRDKTGLPIDPCFCASKIAWILDHVPGIRQRAENGDVLFGTVDTWLVWKLTGGQRHITDASNASRTMLCNIHTLEWDRELLKKFGIPRCMLPDIVPSSQVYGYTVPYRFFGSRIPVAAMAGNQQAALFGQLCLEKGAVKNTYGTGGFLLMNTGNDIVRSSHGLLSTVAWKIGDETTYALEGPVFASGAVMTWMKDELHLFDDITETARLATQAQTTDGVYVVPAFAGLAAPYWDDQAKAAVVGLTFGTGKNQLIRAGLESMAYQVRDVLQVMEQDSGNQIRELKVDGPGSANDFLLQFQADLCQMNLQRSATSELSALGAAYLAGLAVGFWTPEELKNSEQRQFAPERSQQEMNRLYEGWKQAVRTCQSFEPETEDQD